MYLGRYPPWYVLAHAWLVSCLVGWLAGQGNVRRSQMYRLVNRIEL